MSFGGLIGFTSPWLLLALLSLPLLWWLLRAVPPAALRQRFAGVGLLLGLRERDPESERTPWWLLLLRCAALAALLLALAGPVLNPRPGGAGEGPLVVVLDDGWPAARDWPRRMARLGEELSRAAAAGRPVALLHWGSPSAEAPLFRPAEYWSERLAGLQPQPIAPDEAAAAPLDALLEEGGFETFWLSDGVAHPGRAALLAALASAGPVRVFEPETPIHALSGASLGEGGLVLQSRREGAELAEETLSLQAIGRDPAGVERVLSTAPLTFTAGARGAEASLELPPELRNRIERFALEGVRGAGAVWLGDDALRRRKVALLSLRGPGEALALLSPMHYLRQALAPSTDLVESAALADLLLTGPDVLVMNDAPGLTPEEIEDLTEWVRGGGLLLRFAGPRLAGSEPLSGAEDPLLPVRLRTGGRTVGGAMSWGTPQRLAPFAEDGLFAGLTVPADVEIRAQILAEPGPDLAEATLAQLVDGTPLVTRRALGGGQVVLFHVTAGADWSNLPLSGLFVRMLERLTVTGRGGGGLEAGALEGRSWLPLSRLDGFGRLHSVGDRPAVEGAALAAVLAGEAMPDARLSPGIYSAQGSSLALNTVSPHSVMSRTSWPPDVAVETGASQNEQGLAGWFLGAALIAFALDILATLAVSGRLVRGAAAAVLLALMLPQGAPAEAQSAAQSGGQTDIARALAATESVVLAHVASGDPEVDQIAAAGLRGLSAALFMRSSVEPGEPMLVDPATDDLALYPFLYWPVTEDSPLPGAEAVQRLNRFLRAGGMILFDTRDAEITGLSGAESAAGRRLREITRGLEIPPLETVPADHVLTRTFYLLGDFPGRYSGSPVWVEAAPAGAERAEGMPFRNLNDGVTPVVLGGNDWAAAWAVDESGAPLLQIGRGATGERQREMALRFGINLVMHVLSGNYKSDQVHVPELLQRLGQ